MIKINLNRKKKYFLGLALVSLISFVYLIVYTQPTLKVVSSVPTQNQPFDLSNPTISITFSKELSDTEQSGVSIKMTPEIKFHLLWESNSNLSIIPEDSKILTTNFITNILYHNKTVYSLTTIPLFTKYTSEQLDEQARQQGANDLIFGQTTAQIYKDLPFISKLPIMTNQYTIVYDYVQKNIRVRLQNGATKEIVLKEVTKVVIDIGVDIKKYPIVFITN